MTMNFSAVNAAVFNSMSAGDQTQYLVQSRLEKVKGTGVSNGDYAAMSSGAKAAYLVHLAGSIKPEQLPEDVYTAVAQDIFARMDNIASIDRNLRIDVSGILFTPAQIKEQVANKGFYGFAYMDRHIDELKQSAARYQAEQVIANAEKIPGTGVTNGQYAAMDSDEKAAYLVKVTKDAQPAYFSASVYDAVAGEIENYMKRTAEIDSNFAFEIAGHGFKPQQIAAEVRQKSVIGLRYMSEYISGLKGEARHKPAPAAKPAV